MRALMRCWNASGLWSGGMMWLCISLTCPAQSQPSPLFPPRPPAPDQTNVTVQSFEGIVEVMSRGSERWLPASTNAPYNVLDPGDALRTLEKSRAILRLSNFTEQRLGPLSLVRVLSDPAHPGALEILRGISYFIHRDRPEDHRIRTPTVSLGVRGTEFVVDVAAGDGTTLVTMFDGVVEMTNALGSVLIPAGSQGIARPNAAPVRTPVILADNTRIQWALYYPGILDPDELGLDNAIRLGASLAAYRLGDLKAALYAIPDPPVPESDGERIYLAGLLLSVGLVADSEQLLGALPDPTQTARLAGLARALRLVITAVTRPSSIPESPDNDSTEPKPRRAPVDPKRGHHPSLRAQAETETGVPDAATEGVATRTKAARERPGLAGTVKVADASGSAPAGVSATGGAGAEPWTASEWLAESYREQSRARLEAALEAAREAVALSPGFAFGWARVAELEFSFGRTRQAELALDRSLALGPRNAQAVALRGFLSAANNQIDGAIAHFDRAIELDPALGNAWLGRGLCKIRRGDLEEGRSDLLTAATAEPQRALPRAYLGKAFADAGDSARAEAELNRAKAMDPGDPTPWLYSALLRQSESRVNEAVRDLETSMALGGNRRLYRSRLLLDQDRAVRSANLASVYRDAGLFEVGLVEAARAVSADYANASAHLFVSDSFNTLRDPTRFNLRFETVWFNELLLANLLAPVGAGRLAQNVSQQDYSKLFESDGPGLFTSTEIRTDNQIREVASVYGRHRNTEYALDIDYQHNKGTRTNDHLSRVEWYTTIKHQLTPRDSVLLLAKYQDFDAGDLRQRYNSNFERLGYHAEESQEPILLAGYHHEWNPGSHTLFLGGRLHNQQSIMFPAGRLELFHYSFPGPITSIIKADNIILDTEYQWELEAYTAEIQHIFQSDKQSLIVGSKYQSGDFNIHSQLINRFHRSNRFNTPAADIKSDDDFQRVTGYAYYTVEPLPNFRLTGGLAYDNLSYPANFRVVTMDSQNQSTDQWGPKAALVWNPVPRATVRGFYSRSLGGITLDQSYRLEPAQLAGFSQAHRTIASESLVGTVNAPEFTLSGAGLNLKLASQTFLDFEGQILETDIAKFQAGFVSTNVIFPALPYATPIPTDYHEKFFVATLNQLIGDWWSAGVQYRYTRSEYRHVLPEYFYAVPGSSREVTADLEQFKVFLLFNHPSGFFAGAESLSFFQDTHELPDENFTHWNAFVGYRLPRRRAEVTVGVLNLTDKDYRLYPLNPYQDMPRERVFYTRLNIRL